MSFDSEVPYIQALTISNDHYPILNEAFIFIHYRQGGRLQFRHIAISTPSPLIIEASTVPVCVLDTDVPAIIEAVEMEIDTRATEGVIAITKIESIANTTAHAREIKASCDVIDSGLIASTLMEVKETSSITSNLPTTLPNATLSLLPNIDRDQDELSVTKECIDLQPTVRINNDVCKNESVLLSEMKSSSEIKVRKIISKKTLPNTLSCIEYLLTQNFDSVSSPCILTIVKYVLNILSDPSQSKYRIINKANKTFQEKVMKANGSSELVLSIGFIESQANSSTLQNDSSEEFLKNSLQLLEDAMERLQIPIGDRPKMKVVVPLSVSEIPVEEWDPYKSVIVRTAPQVWKIYMNSYLFQ